MKKIKELELCLAKGAIAWEKTGFRRGWNSALEKIKSCLPNIFALYNTRPTEKELRKLLEELKKE